MRNVLILFVVLLLSAALSMPASAYVYNWAEGFEGAQHVFGQPPGVPWFTPSGKGNTVVVDNPVDTGEKAVQQVGDSSSISAIDLRDLSGGHDYYYGWASARIYDPGDDPDLHTDGRFAIWCASLYGPDSPSSSFIVGPIEHRSATYFAAQWS